MCLRNADLEIKKIPGKCYLSHPNRNEDIDDVLLDSANQLEIDRTDLIQWVTSIRSWYFIDLEPEPEVSDFFRELESLCA